MCAARVYGFTNKVVINDKGDNITNDGQDNGTVIVNTLLLPPMIYDDGEQTDPKTK